MFEIFFHFKIAIAKPSKKLSENKSDIYDSMLLSAAVLIDSKNFINSALKNNEAKFVLEKANINPKELKLIEVDKNSLISKSLEITQKLNKNYIQASYLLTSYLLLTESQTKLLFNKDLKEDDLLKILSWMNLLYPQEEKNNYFPGTGIADDWVFGWISQTQKYMLDLTTQILRKKRFFYPRPKEYSLLLSNLSSSKSTILVGSAGSGKYALIEQFAIDSFEGKLDRNLNHFKVFQFLIDEFLSGAKERGEISERFSSIMEEISHTRNIMVFIENIEVILGSSDFDFDISNALIPYLKESGVKIIGSTTPEMFRQNIEKRTALLDLISVISISDPGPSEDLFILFEKSFEFEAKYKVKITYKAVLESLGLGNKYLPAESMPGSAVRLLEDTVSAVSFQKGAVVDLSDVRNTVQQKTKIPVSAPTKIEKIKLLNLEEEIHKSVIDQNEAVSDISEAIRRVRSGLASPNKPTSFLFLGPTGVGKTQTAKTVSNIYFSGEKEIIRLDMSEYANSSGVEKMLDSSSGSFMDQVFNHPYSLILLDEFEKSDPKVQNLFLQILDDGRLTDNSGRTVSFANTLIVATSNAGSEFTRENISEKNSLPANFNKTLIDYLLKQNIFRPELLNRFDGLVVFKPLSQQDIQSIAKLVLSELQKSLETKDIFVTFDNPIIEKVSQAGFDPQFGARPLRRFVQDFIEDPLSRAMLEDKIRKGSKITISLNPDGSLKFS